MKKSELLFYVSVLTVTPWSATGQDAAPCVDLHDANHCQRSRPQCLSSDSVRRVCARTCNSCHLVGSSVSFFDTDSSKGILSFRFGGCPIAKNTPLNATVESDSLSFAVQLFRQLRLAKPDRPFVYSPVTLAVNLAMLHADTRESLQPSIRRSAFSSLSDDRQVGKVYAPLAASVGATATARMATMIMTYYRHGPKTHFTNRAASCYSTPVVSTASIKTELAGAARIVGVTLRQLDPAVPHMDNLQIETDDVNLLLASSFTYRNKWNYVIEPSAGDRNLIRIRSILKYTEDSVLRVRLVALPFRGDTQTLYLLLADDEANYARFETILTKKRLEKMMRDMKDTPVDITLARFKASGLLDMSPIFDGMKIDALSTPGFTSSFRRPSELKMDKFVHETEFQVNNHGAGPISALTSVANLHADAERAALFRQRFLERPMPFNSIKAMRFTGSFLYFVKDTKSGTILLMGRQQAP